MSIVTSSSANSRRAVCQVVASRRLVEEQCGQDKGLSSHDLSCWPWKPFSCLKNSQSRVFGKNRLGYSEAATANVR